LVLGGTVALCAQRVPAQDREGTKEPPAATDPVSPPRKAEPAEKEGPKAGPTPADLLKQASETAHSIDDQTHKVWVLISVAEAQRALTAAQAKAGKLKEAAKTAEGITHDLSRVVALLTLARAHRAAKDGEAAAEQLRQARKVVEGIEENEQTDTRAVADGALAEGLAEAGDAKEARKRAGAIKKEMWKAGAFWRVAAAQARTGDVKGALETAGSIED